MSIEHTITTLGERLPHALASSEIRCVFRKTEHAQCYSNGIECGGEIGVKRLLSYPVAARCIACQERHEKTHAHEATSRM